MKIKKILCIVIAALMLCALVACDGEKPTEQPTAAPTEAPTALPTEAPIAVPTEGPTAAPTEAPTAAPTEAPTTPTEAPTVTPTEAPTQAPTEPVTEPATEHPSETVDELEAEFLIYKAFASFANNPYWICNAGAEIVMEDMIDDSIGVQDVIISYANGNMLVEYDDGITGARLTLVENEVYFYLWWTPEDGAREEMKYKYVIEEGELDELLGSFIGFTPDTDTDNDSGEELDFDISYESLTRSEDGTATLTVSMIPTTDDATVESISMEIAVTPDGYLANMNIYADCLYVDGELLEELEFSMSCELGFEYSDAESLVITAPEDADEYELFSPDGMTGDPDAEAAEQIFSAAQEKLMTGSFMSHTSARYDYQDGTTERETGFVKANGKDAYSKEVYADVSYTLTLLDNILYDKTCYTFPSGNEIYKYKSEIPEEDIELAYSWIVDSANLMPWFYSDVEIIYADDGAITVIMKEQSGEEYEIVTVHIDADGRFVDVYTESTYYSYDESGDAMSCFYTKVITFDYDVKVTITAPEDADSYETDSSDGDSDETKYEMYLLVDDAIDYICNNDFTYEGSTVHTPDDVLSQMGYTCSVYNMIGQGNGTNSYYYGADEDGSFVYTQRLAGNMVYWYFENNHSGTKEIIKEKYSTNDYYRQMDYLSAAELTFLTSGFLVEDYTNYSITYNDDGTVSARLSGSVYEEMVDAYCDILFDEEGRFISVVMYYKTLVTNSGYLEYVETYEFEYDTEVTIHIPADAESYVQVG
ncbi:MAG: PT domain-containing protein [Clostridia bacterium]|nr:PT domain-containing protein [Clostridia bacterium]